MLARIKRVFRYFGIISGQIFSSPVYWTMCILFVLLGVCGADVRYGMEKYTLIEVLFDNNMYTARYDDIAFCANTLFQNYDSFEWFSVILPVITAFPFYKVYITQTTAVRYQYWSRLSVAEYTFTQFLGGFVSGFSVALCGLIFYGGLVFLLFPDMSAYEEEVMAYIVLPSEKIIGKMLNCCLASGVFPILSIVLHRFVRDDFLAMTIPMMFQYLSIKIDGLIAFAMYDPITFEPDTALGVLSALMPSNCLNHWSVWESLLATVVPIGLIVLAAVLLVLYLALVFIIRHSIRSGS